MKMIWHIMKKDLRAIWPLWLSWIGLIAVRIFLLYYYLNIADMRALDLLPMVTGFGILADVILIATLVQSLVHEDGMVGDKVAWVTRPVSGGQLLLAKGVNSLLVCVVSPLVLLFPIWLVLGCDKADMTHVLVNHCLLNGSVMVMAFAFAVVTKQGSSFWLVVVSSVIAAALIATGAEQGLGFRVKNQEVYWLTLLVGVAIVLAGIAWQYITRRVWMTRSVFGVLVVATGLLLPSSSGKSLFKERERTAVGDTAVKISWQENKLVLDDKGSGIQAQGAIELSTQELLLAPRIKYMDGLWLGEKGQTQRAECLDNNGYGAGNEWIHPAKIDASAGQYRYTFPVSLSAPKFDEQQSAKQVGFDGKVFIAFWRKKNLAEAELVAGQSVHQGNFHGRVVSVKTYEKAIETKTVVVGFGNGGILSVSAMIQSPEVADWHRKMGYGESYGMLLWVRIQSNQSTFVPPEEMRNLKWSAKDRGAPTHEDLCAKKWSIAWKGEAAVRSSTYELKAERLEIAKE